VENDSSDHQEQAMKIDASILASLPFELQAEISENLCRKDWTPSEVDALRRRCEALLKVQAKSNQATAGPSSGRGAKRSGGGKLPPALKGKTRDKIGAFAGVSGRTVEKIAAVVDAAKAQPAKFGKLLADMDRTGRVNGAYRRLKNAQQAALILAEPPPLPNRGPYRGAMGDVPWAYESDDDDAPQRGVLPYPTMSIEQLCALDVGSIMHADSVLGLWVTNLVLVRGLHLPVLRAWGGFEPKTILTWPKDRVGRGDWLKGQTEHLIIAVRGNPIVTLSDQTTLLRGPFHLVSKGAHSAKPIEAYGWFESLVPAPRYADLFSRYRHNDKWDCHGDEAPGNDAPTPDQQRLVEGLKATADTKRHLDARRKRNPAPEGER
jgi:N6-adenosine-specific RNA methylase IME4